MRLYFYHDETAPHGQRAFTAFRTAKSARAKAFRRRDRPEILWVEIGNLTAATACALLTGEGYAKEMGDTGW